MRNIFNRVLDEKRRYLIWLVFDLLFVAMFKKLDEKEECTQAIETQGHTCYNHRIVWLVDCVIASTFATINRYGNELSARRRDQNPKDE